MKHKKQRDRGSRDDDEIMRGMIRERDKLIRSLEKRIKYLEKQLNYADNIIENTIEHDETYTIEERNVHNNCKVCRSSDVKKVDISKRDGNLSLIVCQTCLHRQKL